MIAWASNASCEGPCARAAKNPNPKGRLGPSKLQMDRFREIPMPYASQVRARPPIAMGAADAGCGYAAETRDRCDGKDQDLSAVDPGRRGGRKGRHRGAG